MNHTWNNKQISNVRDCGDAAAEADPAGGCVVERRLRRRLLLHRDSAANLGPHRRSPPRVRLTKGDAEMSADFMDECCCGHVADEHDPACTVEDCPCVYFEACDDEDDE